MSLTALGLPPAPATPDALTAAGWKPRTPAGHMGHIGPLWTRQLDDGQWVYGLLAGPAHLNAAGIVHGGVLLSLADQAVSTAAWSATERAACVTVQLDSHFVTAVQAGEFVYTVPQVVRSSKSLVFVRAELMVQSALVLSAQGIMKVMRKA